MGPKAILCFVLGLTLVSATNQKTATAIKQLNDQSVQQSLKNTAVPSTLEMKEKPVPAPACVIGCDIPTWCPPGQQADSNGNCRDIWGDG